MSGVGFAVADGDWHLDGCCERVTEVNLRLGYEIVNIPWDAWVGRVK